MTSALDKVTTQRLVGRYLKNPDPVAWAAFADHCEEVGAEDLAILWRRRSVWYPPIKEAFDQLVKLRTNDTRVVVSEEHNLTIRMIRKLKSIKVTIRRKGYLYGVSYTAFISIHQSRESNYVRRLIEVIDSLKTRGV